MHESIRGIMRSGEGRAFVERRRWRCGVCVLGDEVRAGDAGKRVAWEIQALARQRGGGAEMGGGVNEIRRQMDD